MKTAEKTSTTFARSTPVELQPMRSAKIRTEHLEKLAIVYVRQSTQQQILDHRESTARQYALVHYTEQLGWPAERVLLIDEDQGQSGKVPESRLGFQRLLAEVTMEHVGLPETGTSSLNSAESSVPCWPIRKAYTMPTIRTTGCSWVSKES